MVKWLLTRTIHHLCAGTFLSATSRELQLIKRKRCLKRWEKHAGSSAYIDVCIQKDVRMRLYADSLLSRLIRCEEFETDERDFVNRYLRAGDCFVDVGANIGLFTLIAAHRVGSGGKVFAFEPDPGSYARLEKNLYLNRLQNVTCLQVALSDHPCQASFYQVLDDFDALNSLSAPFDGRPHREVQVTCRTWDQFQTEHPLARHAALVKIDVEGWETRLLAGGRRNLSKSAAPDLMVEFTDRIAAAAGSSCRELYDALTDLGYGLYRYEPKRRRLVPEPPQRKYPYLNLIATKHPAAVNCRIQC